MMTRIRLSAPDITEAEIAEVLGVLRTNSLSLGPKLPEFEKAMADYIGVRHAVAVNSGTSGLHLCAEALGIRPGDEVITSPFSFIASSNCAIFQGARPVFVDIEEDSLNLNPDLIPAALTDRTTAIVGVDIFGLPADWNRLEKLAKDHKLRLIEDSCEALGAEYHGRKAGAFGECAVFAFYPNKQMTTGEGGIIVTDSAEIADHCRSLRNQGRGTGDGWLSHTYVGYNYRLSDINCALGIAQLRRIEEILAKRQAVAEMYDRRFREIEEVTPLAPVAEMKRSWFVYVIRLSKRYTRDDRGRIVDALRERGIDCAVYFPPIHLQPIYRERFGYKEGDFPVTESVSARTIALPFHNNLTEGEVDRVVDTLKEVLG